jgi:hypothetical protein
MCENMAQFSHCIIGQANSSLMLQTHRVESPERLERSVKGVLVLEAGRADENVGDGGVGNLVMSMVDLGGIGFVAALRLGLIVAFGSDVSADQTSILISDYM